MTAAKPDSVPTKSCLMAAPYIKRYIIRNFLMNALKIYQAKMPVPQIRGTAYMATPQNKRKALMQMTETQKQLISAA